MSGPTEDVWGLGRYEDTAADLYPAAEVAVGALGLSWGERVLDVGCGTGNAAAAAARVGARVAGLDPSPRLISVARGRVPEGDFVVGDALELPYDGGDFDAAVSIFAVIFVAPAERAVGELVRVVRPGGRIAITAWPPRGPVFRAISLMREAMARARPPQGPRGPDWGDPAVIHELLDPHGAVEVSEHELPAEERSAEEVWDRWERLHPIWIAARRVLEPAGEWERLRESATAALREGEGERPVYLLAVLTRA